MRPLRRRRGGVSRRRHWLSFLSFQTTSLFCRVFLALDFVFLLEHFRGGRGCFGTWERLAGERVVQKQLVKVQLEKEQPAPPAPAAPAAFLCQPTAHPAPNEAFVVLGLRALAGPLCPAKPLLVLP